MCKAKKIISLLLAVVMLMGVMSAIEMSSIAGARELTISASASNSLTKKQAKKLKENIKKFKFKNPTFDRLKEINIDDSKLFLTWDNYNYATSYNIKIFKNSNFTKLVTSKTINKNVVSISKKKFKYGYYYVKIRACAKYKINGKTKKAYSKWKSSSIFVMV